MKKFTKEHFEEAGILFSLSGFYTSKEIDKFQELVAEEANRALATINKLERKKKKKRGSK